MNDIEKLFYDDVREKKRTATGVFHRATRLGYTGAVKTQVDFLKGKEKKKYMGNGEVRMSNLYDKIANVPTVEQLYKMDPEQATSLLKLIREKHSANELRIHWGFKSQGKMYSDVFYKFNVVGSYGGRNKNLNPKVKKPSKVKEKKVKDTEGNDLVKEIQKNLVVIDQIKPSSFQETLVADDIIKLQKEIARLKQELAIKEKHKFSIGIDDQLVGEEFLNKLELVANSVSKEATYKIEIKIVEV